MTCGWYRKHAFVDILSQFTIKQKPSKLTADEQNMLVQSPSLLYITDWTDAGVKPWPEAKLYLAWKATQKKYSIVRHMYNEHYKS